MGALGDQSTKLFFANAFFNSCSPSPNNSAIKFSVNYDFILVVNLSFASPIVFEPSISFGMRSA